MNESTGPLTAEAIHRMEVRREQLGMTMAELAASAGMSPRYLEHLTEAGTDFDPDGLMRLAAALQMTSRELVEGRADSPPGQPAASGHPILMTLTPDECWQRIGTHGIGRVALSAEPSPVVFPVNYTVHGRAIAYRTKFGGAAAAEPGSPISFEADHIDEHMQQGWSVLISGTAEHITDPDMIRHLSAQPTARPWAGGARYLWIHIEPIQISGRQIHSLS